MTGVIRPHSLLLAVLTLLPVACGRAQGDQAIEPLPPFVLTAQEIQLTRALAEEKLAIIPEPSHPLDRTCFIKIDLLPDSQAETQQRQVMVHHYRYRDDVTILTMVDLNRAEVLSVENKAHYPTALCQEELARAERLTRADARVKSILDARSTPVFFEGRPQQITDQADPRFDHRLVLWSLRSDGGYLTGPRVLVDLTTETVIVND
jgi:hypothetical protein